MSDRGVLLLLSLCVIFAALGVAAWLIGTGQIAYIDGLFLLLSCLVLAAAFGLYVRYLIRSVMQETALRTGAKITPGTRQKPVPAARVSAVQAADEEGERAKVLRTDGRPVTASSIVS